MNCKERMIATIEGKGTDFTPYHFDLPSRVISRIGDYYNISKDSVERFIGNHILYLGYSAPDDFIVEKLGDGRYKDEFGIIRNTVRNDIGDVGIEDHPIKNMSLEGYSFPDPYKKGRFDHVENIIQNNPGCFNVFTLQSFFETSWAIAGIEDVLAGLIIEPAFINELFDKVVKFMMGLIEQLPRGIDGVRFLDDWGDQRGLIMGKENWLRYYKPRLKELYGLCKKKGLYIIAHSCGNITDLFPDLIELGVDVINPIQPEVMDIKFIKKKYGKDIVLYGGVGSQSTIPLGKPEDVIKEVKETLAYMSEGGNYILGPAGSIPTETHIENIAAFIDFCRDMSGLSAKCVRP